MNQITLNCESVNIERVVGKKKFKVVLENVPDTHLIKILKQFACRVHRVFTLEERISRRDTKEAIKMWGEDNVLDEIGEKYCLEYFSIKKALREDKQ